MLRPRGALGRGLGALLPTGSGLTDAEVDAIVRNPRQPRQHVDAAALQELAQSIREHGVLQPLIVRELPGSGDRRFELIAGERRWHAARLAGLSRVPVVVKDVTPQAQLELALVENIQRADLSPLEEAAAYRQLIEEFGLTHEALARRLGKNRVTITNTLRLLALPEPAKAALAAAEITEGHARALLALPDDEARLQALRQVKNLRLSVRQTEELVRRWGETPAPREAGPTPPGDRLFQTLETRALEEQFRAALGTKVVLRRSRRGGTLTVHFYSDEELQGLHDLIVRPPPD
ncbi:MAG TPA: ParB/RepB/Spo0J family partition protein [Chloroflexota bacterium]|jgi:ParB family chromosome partitioning protein|nr:ParB/RepB/Spo0J family partition protein [Chloroflexota bacterium]